VRVLGGEAVGVLVHVERAHQHRTGGLQPAHQEGVLLRPRQGAIDLRAGQGDLALDVEQVLDRIRQPGQRRQQVAAREADASIARGPLVAAAGKGVDAAIGRLDARDAGIQRRARAELAGGDRAQHGGALKRRFAHGHLRPPWLVENGAGQ
jgi:hypothetical protein